MLNSSGTARPVRLAPDAKCSTPWHPACANRRGGGRGSGYSPGRVKAPDAGTKCRGRKRPSDGARQRLQRPREGSLRSLALAPA